MREALVLNGQKPALKEGKSWRSRVLSGPATLRVHRQVSPDALTLFLMRTPAVYDRLVKLKTHRLLCKSCLRCFLRRTVSRMVRRASPIVLVPDLTQAKPKLKPKPQHAKASALPKIKIVATDADTPETEYEQLTTRPP